MVRLSRLTDYAVVLLAAMAGKENTPLSASSIANDVSLPEPTVSKLLKILAKAGIVSSTRGVNGGYTLAVDPGKLAISKVIEAVEGPIALVGCVEGSEDPCAIQKVCRLHGRWDVVNKAIKTALDDVSLADMQPNAKSAKSA